VTRTKRRREGRPTHSAARFARGQVPWNGPETLSWPSPAKRMASYVPVLRAAVPFAQLWTGGQKTVGPDTLGAKREVKEEPTPFCLFSNQVPSPYGRR
jgi:hypothetical protein